VSLARFARLAGHGVRVVGAGGSAPGGGGAGTVPAGIEAADGLGVPELVAEAALLQARLDWFQTQLARLGQRGDPAGPQG
jgi:hypothetical protein